jgi:Fic family protein
MEGVPVTVEEVRRILAGDRPPDVSVADADLVEGYRDALRFSLGRADAPGFRWNGELIVGLHDRLLGGDTAAGAGRFATGPRFVARTGDPIFEPPPASEVVPLVEEMCERLSEEGLHPAVAAAWVHIATAAIHPFRDGNGRCARVLASLAMYRGGFRLWAFTTLESWWGHHADDYYADFTCLGDRFDRRADVTPFIVAHAGAQLSQVRALDLREQIEHRIWAAIAELVRGAGLDERVANAVWEGFFQRDVTAGYYRSVVEVSPATATYDLRAAVASGLLRAEGQRRGRRYLSGPGLYPAVGQILGIDPPPQDAAPIVGFLARRIAGDGGSRHREVEVRTLHLLRDAVLDYEVEVREDGRGVGRVRASLSPEAWVAVGRMLGVAGWSIPSGDRELAGEQAAVALAFVDVVVEVISASAPVPAGEVKVNSTDEALLRRIGDRARERLAAGG